MTPLFWRCEYVRLCGGSSKLLALTEENQFFDDFCENEIVTKPKYLLMVDSGGQKVQIPGRATFGGVWSWTPKAIDSEPVSSFYDYVINAFGSNSIEIHLPPEYFYPEIFELQHEMITSRGGKRLYVETSHFIDIESWAPGTMSKGNKKKLRQCVENSVTTVELSIAELGTVYELIMNNRLSRGVSLSISLSQLRASFLQMPKSYRCYGTFLGSDMIAAAVTVLITDDFEYVYMWADDVNHRGLSPVVTLCEAIVADSKSRGVRTLDLGISSKHGVLDEGLSRFKVNLGALTGAKISYII